MVTNVSLSLSLIGLPHERLQTVNSGPYFRYVRFSTSKITVAHDGEYCGMRVCSNRISGATGKICRE